MLINGEKWACDACVRGHRVSNCQHYDRPLQHINKKGRPVTQCQHCRSQRKNRSAHVKCDCGEKTTKCIHLGALDGHRESCCCNHGGDCTCSLKKEGDAASPNLTETSSAKAVNGAVASSVPAMALSGLGSASTSASKTPIRRRRANTTRSEGTLTFDEHGRHKPASHKHTKTQKTSPYPTSRINSVRSTGMLSNLMAASKSANNEEEPDDDDHSSGLGGSDSGADDDCGFVSMNTPASTTTTSAHNSFNPGDQAERLSRSATTSPLHLDSSFPQPHQLSDTNQHLPPLNMSAVDYMYYSPFESADQPLFSAGLKAPTVDWNQFFGNTGHGLGGSTGGDAGKFGSTGAFGFAGTFGYEYNGSEQAPTMTTATSGEVSEAEDLMAPGVDDYDYDYDGANDATNSSVAFSRASSSYRLATYGDMRLHKAGNKFLPTPTGAEDAVALAAGGALAEEETAIWMPEYQGLTSMTESPESDVISFWGSK